MTMEYEHTEKLKELATKLSEVLDELNVICGEEGEEEGEDASTDDESAETDGEDWTETPAKSSKKGKVAAMLAMMSKGKK